MPDDFPEDSFFRNSNVAVLEAALQEGEGTQKPLQQLTQTDNETEVAKSVLECVELLGPVERMPSNQSLKEVKGKKRAPKSGAKNKNTSTICNNEEDSNDKFSNTLKIESFKNKSKSSYRPLSITRNAVLQSKILGSSASSTNYLENEDNSLQSDRNYPDKSDHDGSSILSTQQKLKLDTWGLPRSILKQYAKRNITEMFPWQVECLCCPRVLSGGNLVYSAPTSAGKTLVSEIVCIKTVLERHKKAIFVLPFVSVVREKMFYFQDIFRGSRVRVDGYMGGHSAPGGFRSLDLAVCTIEKANSLVNRLMEEKELDSLGAIVVDELHLIADPHRGYLLELLLTKLKYMSIRNSQISIQIVGMSATLPNLSLLSTWLDADLYKTSFRPVPLEEHIKIGNTLYDAKLKQLRSINPELVIKNDIEDIVYLCLETIANGHSVLIFCPTKSWCESLAQTIASEFRTIGRERDVCAPDSLAFKLREQLNADLIGECLDQLRSCPVGLDSFLGKVVSFGVAYHHAGLSMDERDIVEGCFKNGTLRVLIATSTLSSGVNLPARRVIIRSPVFQGRPIDVLSYRQMVGRAGRMGVDVAGESIIICQKTEQRIVTNLLSSGLKPIESCLGHGDLAASLKRAVLEVVASGVASTPEDLQLYTNCTLLASSQKEMEKDNNPVASCITFLEHNELIRLQTDEDGILRYSPTPLGQACLSASIHPDEGLRLFQELQRARQCFVLENELHLVYQVTPFNVADQWGNLDWLQVLALWEQLTPDMRRVGELVGVDDRFIVRAMRGTVNVKLEKQCQKMMIHRRFYTALALHDLVNEVPLNKVATKFNCSRGMLQSLQQSASTYAGMVASFCRRLGWSSVELLIDQFQDRLHFGTHRELLDLLRLPSLNGPRARALYNSGITCVSELTTADVIAVENALHSAIPFLSDKERDGETKAELERRKKLKGIWITGRQGLSEREAADLIIKEARSFVQSELGLAEVNWDQKRKDSDPGTTNDSMLGQNVVIDGHGTGGCDVNCSNEIDVLAKETGPSIVPSKDKTYHPVEEVNMNLDVVEENIFLQKSTVELLSVDSDKICNSRQKTREVTTMDSLEKETEDRCDLDMKSNVGTYTVEPFQGIDQDQESFSSFSDSPKVLSTDVLENNICDISNVSEDPSSLQINKTSAPEADSALLGLKMTEHCNGKLFDSSFSCSILAKLDGPYESKASVIGNEIKQGLGTPPNDTDSYMGSWEISTSALDRICVQEENEIGLRELDTGGKERVLETVQQDWKGDEPSKRFSSSRNSSDLFDTSIDEEGMPENTGVQDGKESEDLFGSFMTPVCDRVLRSSNSSSASISKSVQNVSNALLFSDDSGSPSLFGDSFEINTGLIKVLDGDKSESPVPINVTKGSDVRFSNLPQKTQRKDLENDFPVPFTRTRRSEMRRKCQGPVMIPTNAETTPGFQGTVELRSPVKKTLFAPKSSNRYLGLSRRKLPKQSVSKKDQKSGISTSQTESRVEILTDSFLEAAFQSAFDHDIVTTHKHPQTKPQEPCLNNSRKGILSESSDEEILFTQEDAHKNGYGEPPKSSTVVLSETQGISQDLLEVHKLIGPPQTHRVLALSNLGSGSNKLGVGLKSNGSKGERSEDTEFKSPFQYISDDNWKTFKIIDICRSARLFKVFSKDILNSTLWSMALACERNHDVKSVTSIGSKILRMSSRQCSKSQKISSLAYRDVHLVGVSFCFGGTDAYFFSLETGNEQCVISLSDRLELLQKLLCRKEKGTAPMVCCFDLKEQFKMLFRCCGVQIHNISLCDPKVSDWLLDPEGKEKSFRAMVLKYMEQAMCLLEHAGQVQLGQGSPGFDVDQIISGRQRSAIESILCYQVMRVQYEMLLKAGLLSSFHEVEMPVVLCVGGVELTGIGFGSEIARNLQERLRTEMSVLERRAYQLAGRSFSLTSPADTARVLYQELRLGQRQSLKGRQRDTKKETLNKLCSEHPLPGVILSWRKLNAIYSKTICPLLPSEPCSRLFGCYVMHTATGRISMHEPNIQCIPREFVMSSESKEPFCMRSAFVASKGNKLVAADYSQLELRLLAHMSNEPKLRDVLNCGQDVFCSLAASWNGLSFDQVSDSHRQKAKQMCYGIIYGMGSKALADQLEVEESEAKKLMESFHIAFPGISDFLSKTIEECHDRGYVKTLLGRRRFLPGITSANIHVRAHAERQAVNTTIQGSAADLAKTAMISIEKDILKWFPQALVSSGGEFSLDVPRLVLHLHDELMYEVPNHLVDQFCQILKSGMENAIPLSISLPVKIKVGKSWGNLESI